MKENLKAAKNVFKTSHHVLAHSYSFYFFLFLVGVVLDLVLHIEFFEHPFLAPVGLVLLVLATVLIFWAQYTSHRLADNPTTEHFCKGPYCYTRTPTHLGLFFLILGFALLTNAFFLVVTTLVSFILSKLLFINKQEDLLAEKYGTPYLEYKKKVKF